MGTATGWETRRRRQAQQEREWSDACFEAGKAEGHQEARELLERCLLQLLAAELKEGPDGEWNQTRVELVADLRGILGKGNP